VPPGHAGRREARTLYKKGLQAFRSGDDATAIDFFQRAEDAEPTYPHPTFALGQIYQTIFEREVDHYEDAVAAYQRLDLLLKNSPPPAKEKVLYQAYHLQGLLYLKGGEYAEALRCLETFLRIQPDYSDIEYVYNAIGIALYYLDRYDQAVDAFRRSISVDPDYAEARFNLRSVFTRLSVYNEAVAIARAGELELAMEKVQRLKEFAPRYPPGRRLEAKLLDALGQTSAALRVYGEILSIDPNAPITYSVRIEMAKIMAARGEKEAAMQLLTDNLVRLPDIPDERARAEVVELLVRLGKTQ
jgi:tetratricopeptide (TPR) repeat protein